MDKRKIIIFIIYTIALLLTPFIVINMPIPNVLLNTSGEIHLLYIFLIDINILTALTAGFIRFTK